MAFLRLFFLAGVFLFSNLNFLNGKVSRREPDMPERDVLVAYPVALYCDRNQAEYNESWVQLDGSPLAANFAQDKGQFFIKHTGSPDKGLYSCQPVIPSDEPHSSEVVRLVIVPDLSVPKTSTETPRLRPKIVPAELTVVEGDPVNVTCYPAAGREDDSVEWLPGVLPDPSRLRTSDGILNLEQAQVNDTGTYYCRHKTFPHQDEISALRLIVHSDSPVALPPVIVTIPIFPSAGADDQVGGPVVLEYTSEDPNAEITWYRNSVGGPVVAGPARGSLNHTIPQVQPEDAGDYVCGIVTAAGATASFVKTITVDRPVVTEPPPTLGRLDTVYTPAVSGWRPVSRLGLRIEPWQQTVEIGPGTRAQFECIHPEEGQRYIAYSWTRTDNRPLPAFAIAKGKTLVFNGVSDYTPGGYMCTITGGSELDNMAAMLYVVGDDGEYVAGITPPSVATGPSSESTAGDLEVTANKGSLASSDLV